VTTTIAWSDRWSAQKTRGELAAMDRTVRRAHLDAYIEAAQRAGADPWDDYSLAVAAGLDAEWLGGDHADR
jgi:hypothetical protein